jgi:hypothetical protein
MSAPTSQIVLERKCSAQIRFWGRAYRLRSVGVSRAGTPFRRECTKNAYATHPQKAAILPSQLTPNATDFLNCRP